LTVTDGYVDFSADSSVSGLVLSGDGGLAGTGTLTVNGPFTWTSGNVDEGTIFAAGGTDFHGGSYDYLNNATFINPSGQVATIGASGNKFLSIGGQSAFVNAGSLVASAGTIGNFSTDFGTTFQNTGTFTVTAVMGTTVLVNTAVLFENTGTVGVQSGTLALNASDAGATGGTFSASTGATLAFGGNFAFAPSSVINGAGTIKFAGGVDIVSGTFNVQGATICSAGNISFPVTVSSFGPTGLTVASQSAYYGPVTHVDLGGQDISLPGLNFAGGVLAGSGTLTIGGLFAWSGGTLTVAKTMANGGIALTYGGISGPTLSGGTLVNPVGQTATLV
jgi:hypothetical protein